MKMNERDRCGRCQKWVNIYKDFYLDPRDEKGIMPCVCKKCSEIIEKEMQKV